MDEVVCPFCNILMVSSCGIKVKREKCCFEMEIINDNGMRVCKKCGQVDGYNHVQDYIDFYENKFKIRRKSVYYRKYHIEKIILDRRIVMSRDKIEKICSIFKEVENISGTIDKKRKRMISVEYLLTKILKKYFPEVKHNMTDINKSKKTLKYYRWYWINVECMIGEKIRQIVSR